MSALFGSPRRPPRLAAILSCTPAHLLVLLVVAAPAASLPGPTPFASECGQWSPIPSAGSPPGGVVHTTVFDPIHHRLIGFGFGGGGLWSFSLQTRMWTQLAYSGAEPPHDYAIGTTVYDSARDRMIYIVQEDTDLPVQAWELSLAGTPTWNPLVPLGATPDVAWGCAAIYDPVRDRVLGYGGIGNTVLWELSFSGSTATWATLSASQAPAIRWDHAPMYDPVRDRFMFYGGIDTFAGPPHYTVIFDEIWYLNLADESLTWRELTPAGGLPSARYGAASLYDENRDRMLVFGGNAGTSYPRDTWAISFQGGPASQNLTAQVGLAPARVWFPAGYDAVYDQVILFGGYSDGILNDTHELPLAGINVSVVIEPASAGVVTISPDSSCYTSGTPVTLTAQAATGYAFSHWSGDESGSANPLTVTLDRFKTVTAHFTQQPPEITSFVPDQGLVSSQVSIHGSVFAGATQVAFNGVSGSFTVVSWTRIDAIVPEGATDGPITVTTPYGSATSAESFRVLPTPTTSGKINLSWNDCGTAGNSLQTFACDGNSGPPFALFASFEPPAAMTEFLGMSAQIDIRSDAASLPDWWKHGSGQCRGNLGLTIAYDFTAGPISCVDFYLGQATGGFAYDIGFVSADRARLRVQCAVPFDQRGPLDPGMEYYAFRVNLTRLASSGAEACSGCGQEACIVLNELQLFQPPERAYDPSLTEPLNQNHVSWQIKLPSCPQATPVQVDVVTIESSADRVRLVWLAPLVSEALVQRRASEGEWRTVARLLADGEHRFVYDDEDVTPGATYDYRLMIIDQATPRYLGEISVTVSIASRLALAQVAWNRDGRGGLVGFSLPRHGNATFEVFDPSGRRVARQAFDGLSAGPHEVELSTPSRMASGTYFLRLTHGGESVARRFLVIH